MTYKLELTEGDMKTIHFVGHRYGWSDGLQIICTEGVNILEEHQAWELNDFFEADTEGDHGYFPMLDQSSELATKLYKFMEEIV